MIHYSLRVALTTLLFAIFTLLVTDTLAATPPLDQPIPNPPSFPPIYHKSSTLSSIRRDTHDQRDNRRMEANKCVRCKYTRVSLVVSSLIEANKSTEMP
jgi:hypothetical protein